jgi:hypothetical protein
LSTKTQRLGVCVLLRAGVAAKNKQTDAKSPAHLHLVKKEDTKDNNNLVVLTNKRCVLRAGTEVGKQLSRKFKEAIFPGQLRKEFKPPTWATVSAYVLGTGLKPADNTFPSSCARSGGVSL